LIESTSFASLNASHEGERRCREARYSFFGFYVMDRMVGDKINNDAKFKARLNGGKVMLKVVR